MIGDGVGLCAGFAGHANYCAANAAVDAIAEHVSGIGLPWLSVQWGAWSGVGEQNLTSRLLHDVWS